MEKASYALSTRGTKFPQRNCGLGCWVSRSTESFNTSCCLVINTVTVWEKTQKLQEAKILPASNFITSRWLEERLWYFCPEGSSNVGGLKALGKKMACAQNIRWLLRDFPALPRWPWKGMRNVSRARGENKRAGVYGLS